MSSITVQDITGNVQTGKLPRISDYIYKRLTGDDDSICEAAIAAAEVWVRAKITQAGQTADFTDVTVREATIKRVLYELYSHGENEEIARDKADDALVLLRAKYGPAIEGDNPAAESEQQGPPVISVQPGGTTWNGFS